MWSVDRVELGVYKACRPGPSQSFTGLPAHHTHTKHEGLCEYLRIPLRAKLRAKLRAQLWAQLRGVSFRRGVSLAHIRLIVTSFSRAPSRVALLYFI